MPSSNPSAVQHIQQNVFMPIMSVTSQSLAFSQPTDASKLYIIEQPKQRMRFRYSTEKGNHGCLTGRKSKSFPTVRLENCRSNSDIYVKASLYTADQEEPRPHFHSFQGQNCEDGTCTVALDKESMIATFENIKIEHCPKKSAEITCLQRYTNNNSSNESCTALKKKAKEEVKKINLSCVRIYFEAFHRTESCPHIIATAFSEPIYNQIDPKCNSLKIVRIDKTKSAMKGDEEVFLLCDKVDKNDIEVKFYEYDSNHEIIWEGNGQFNKVDVHRQFAIVFKTPPYISEDSCKCSERNVVIMLHRPSDGQTSNPIPFTYVPKDKDEQEISRKRKKINHFPDPMELAGEFSGISNPSSVEYSPQESIPSTQHATFNFPGAGGSSTSSNMSSEMNESLNEDTFRNLVSAAHNEMTEDTTPIVCPMSNLFGNEQTPVLSNLGPGSNNPLLSSTMPQDNKYLNFDTSLFSFPSDDPWSLDMLTDSVPELKKPSEGLGVDDLNNELVNLNLSREKKCTVKAVNKQIFAPKKTFTQTVQQYRTKTNKDGDNLLHLAVLHENNLQLLKIFIDALGDHLSELINRQNNLKQTPLHLAIMINCAHIVGVLLDHGADLNIVDKKGNTPLHLAVKHKNLNCLKNIVDKNTCTLNDAINFDGYTALHLSIMNLSENCVRLLVNAGADIWVKDHKSGKTALHMAVLHLPTVVKFLLSKDTYSATMCLNNLNIEDYQGNTALQLAYMNQLPEVAQFLLDVGGTPLLKDSNENDESVLCIPNNNEINDIMENTLPYISTTDDSKYDSPLSSPQSPLSQIDSRYISSNTISHEIVNDATIAKLEELLNPPNDGWKILASFSGVDEELIQNIEILEKESPTKAILSLLVKDGRTAKELLKTLDFAGLTNAYNVVKKYCDEL